MLENDARRIAAPGGPLWVAGLSDYRMRAPSFAVALRDVPPGYPVLALSHDPDVFPRAPARVALTLSGHLHGGQVRLPGVGTRHIPSHYGKRYLAGHIVECGPVPLPSPRAWARAACQCASGGRPRSLCWRSIAGRAPPLRTPARQEGTV